MNPPEIPDYRPFELMQDENITKSNFTDFIGVWDNFMPKPLCEQIVTFCDMMMEMGSIPTTPDDTSSEVFQSQDYYQGSLKRCDSAFLLNYSNKLLCYQINSILRSCASHYIYKYDSLRNTGLISTDIKVQKTPPGGGYHIWHHENANLDHAARELTWMIYLNDMPDGEAETEFLYQRRRIKPTAGTVVIWPAGYTHPHKGNTVMTEDKYILTGWYIKNK